MKLHPFVNLIRISERNSVYLGDGEHVDEDVPSGREDWMTHGEITASISCVDAVDARLNQTVIKIEVGNDDMGWPVMKRPQAVQDC